MNEAALNAARYNQKVVRMADFEFAKDKVMMGSERRSMIITEEEKRVTAIHEAGHALLAVLLPNADPVHKVTIIPRGMALGVTMQLPMDDKHNYSRDYLMDQIAILLGGRIAEEITNGELTTGAGNDLERVTELARKMVCEWGMSDAMGPLTFGKREEQIFLGREISQDAGLQRGHRASASTRKSSGSSWTTTSARDACSTSTSRCCSRSPTSCSRAKCSTPIRCMRLVAGPAARGAVPPTRRAGRRRRRAANDAERPPRSCRRSASRSAQE